MENNSQPLISVIILNYNAGNLLLDCVESGPELSEISVVGIFITLETISNSFLAIITSPNVQVF